MLKILLLSDIHFLYCEEHQDRYRLLKQALLNEMDSYAENNEIDALIVCGDIAFSGQETQYKIAEKYFEEILKKFSSLEKKPLVFVVPGNHDIDRIPCKYTRRLFRDTLIGDQGIAEECLAGIKKSEIATLKMLYRPFKAYNDFADKYSSTDKIAETIMAGGDSFEGTNYSYEHTLGKLDAYIVNIVGLNSALTCDADDIRDANSIRDGQHKLFLPFCAYNVNTDPYLINISVMHHPFEWMQNGSDLDSEFDARFKLQLFGHIHSQSVYQKDDDELNPVKIQVGSLQPGEDEDGSKYAPRYSFIELSVENDKLHVVVKCRKWNKPHFEDDTDPASTADKWVLLQDKKSWTRRQKTAAKAMEEEVIQASSLYELRYRLTKSNHKKEVIEALKPGMYDKNKPQYANAILFFNAIVKEGRLGELQMELDKYE